MFTVYSDDSTKEEVTPQKVALASGDAGHAFVSTIMTYIFVYIIWEN